METAETAELIYWLEKTR